MKCRFDAGKKPTGLKLSIVQHMMIHLQKFRFSSSSHTRVLSTVLLFAFIWVACSAKYKANLYAVTEDGRATLKPTEMFYVAGLGISSPLADVYLLPAKGYLAGAAYSVKDTGTIGGGIDEGIVQYRRRTDYRMFLPLPERLTPGPVTLDNSTFVRNFSNVEVPIAARTYLYSGGSFSIDSIKSSVLYTSLDAVFRSLEGDSLKYIGQMKFTPREKFYFRGTVYRRGE